MIFVIGPAYSGKHRYAQTLCDDHTCVKTLDVACIPDGTGNDLTSIADGLATRYQVLVGTEIGCGIVPVEASERRFREQMGRLQCLVAERATCVIRLYCGIAQVIKGELDPNKVSSSPKRGFNQVGDDEP